MTQPQEEPFAYRFERALVNLRTAVWAVEELMQDSDGLATLAHTRKGRALCDSLRENAVFVQNIVQRLPETESAGHFE